MKQSIIILTLAGSLAASAPAFAADAADVAADQGAIAKDNNALSKDDHSLAKDRARKANDKANENYGKQAVDSTAIGADHLVKGEKTTEKTVDQKIMNHDVNSDNGQ